MASDRFRHCHGFYAWIFGKRIIKASKKFTTRLRVILPRIFAIKDH